MVTAIRAPVRVLHLSLPGAGAPGLAALMDEAVPSSTLRTVHGLEEATAALVAASYDLVLLEAPPDEGLALLAALRQASFAEALVLVSAGGDRALDLAAMQAGATAYLPLEGLDGVRLERVLRYSAVHGRAQAELRRVRADLERVAAAVSHDLRQPLHLVSGYADLLVACCEGKLSPDARHALGQIGFGAQRMNELIDDLVAYARLHRGKVQLEEVDSAFVLDVVERELSAEIRASDAVIERGPLPEVQAYRPLLEQLLRHLIRNAILFAGGSRPCIQVGVETRADDWLFCVRDRGPGIPAVYHDCIFELFTRGPQRDEVEGTGIGLAICNKAAQAHGGRIWVESAPGQGAAFWFTLPRRNHAPGSR
jgi:signal transduction histidine kinase